MQHPPQTPESIHMQQLRPTSSPHGTPIAGPSSTSSSLFTPGAPQMLSSAPTASPQLLDTCVNRMLELQKRMLQFGNDLRSPTPDMDSLQKEQRAQSAEVAALMALLLAERAR
ncbi:hypothetical protein EJ05DRAFT_479572 [Pseudovirgaria hyperparasitica]|uniref:Uncharacterized protein n=1 Tax=Pseudovirgaria hyperparasitica TaxID=470096 RepID=A0A6A6VXP9_9PEZI|nr:uncharacterized protein EJ05DRAFT_479572 [Pseudovirgaria hyperparasitica]KAF2754599.1 hypothetical protein EJ05DRAFT_479572 [Pseudovirgaria hyperparasitica]